MDQLENSEDRIPNGAQRPIYSKATPSVPSAAFEVTSSIPDDLDAVVQLISEAFSTDPAWSWAFPDNRIRTRYWHMFISSAVRYPFVFRTSGVEAASVWIPPGGSSFLPEVSANFDEVLLELASDRFDEVAAFLEQFDLHHPREEPHFYLGLLGVANRVRGLGLGMALLKHNLDLIDRTWSLPVYLESSNPNNDRKYESLGFRKICEFRSPDGPVVSGMWRPAQERQMTR